MASTFSNLFDLLSGDESDVDVTDLYERMKMKAVEEVPSSPPTTTKDHLVFAEISEDIASKEAARGNENGNGTKWDEEGWQVVRVPKKLPAKKVQENRTELANGNGSEHTKGNGHVNGKKPVTNWNGNGRVGRRRGSGGYHPRGKGRAVYGNGGNGQVKDVSNGGNGDRVDAVQINVNSEGDAAVTVESSNDKESEEKETTEVLKDKETTEVLKDEETTEEVKDDVPEPEETAEEKKEKVRKGQIRKDGGEREEKRRLRRQEAAEEAKMMTLDQYEETLSKKKQALNLQKAEARRVVPADDGFDNMKLVEKKKDNEKEKPKGKAVLLKTSESKLAVGLAKLFQPASFRVDRTGRAVPFPSQKFSSKNGPAPAAETLTDQLQFPVLGFVAPELPSAPAPNQSTSSGSNSSESSSAPPANPSTSSGPNSSEPSSRPSFWSGYKNNRSYTGTRPTTTGTNSASATRSATAAANSSSATGER